MMISPVIFCTIVLGRRLGRQAAKVGKVGGLALGYFLVMSTSRWPSAWWSATSPPRVGPAPDPDVAKAGAEQAGEAGSTTDFLLGIIPTTLVSALTEGEVLQTLLVALLVGFARAGDGRDRASRSCAASSTCSGWSSGCWR